MRATNKTLNHKLVSSINKSRSSAFSNNSISHHPHNVNVSNEALQQYNDLLKEFNAIGDEYKMLCEKYKSQCELSNSKLADAQTSHEKLKQEESSMRKQILDDLMTRQKNSKSIKSEIDNLIASEMTSSCEMSKVQLENLKLQERLESLKVAIQTSNETMTGCHLIDYEQLTAENQTLQEKIDERIKEVQKLEEKTNQVFTALI